MVDSFRPELGITVGGNIAFCHSLNRMRGTEADGGHQDLWFRATLGLRKAGSAWKIAHEHTSTPYASASPRKGHTGRR